MTVVAQPERQTERVVAVAQARGRRGRGRWLTHAGLILFAFAMLYPILWMLSSSFKPVEIIFSDVSLWPQSFSLDSYIQGWTALPVSFGTFFLNSFIVSIGAVVGTLLSCSMAAYAFARLNFRFKRVYFALMLGTIMLPQHVLVVPQYILFLRLDWLNTFLPLVVPHFLGTGAFFIFLMVQFMRGIPRDLDDAAKIDGAGPFQTYWQIILPLSKPALVTGAIFIFIWTWDEFFTPLLYLTDVGKYTVALGLRLFLDSTGESSWGMLFAMSMLSLVPIFVVFLVFQRLLVEGITTSGLKG